MAPRVYVETTIPSYLVTSASRDIIIAGHQQTTHDWWNNRRRDFELYISQFVEDECRAGDAELSAKRLNIIKDLPMLAVSPDVLFLAERFISKGPLPPKAEIDAFHISVASVNRMDFLLTWNLKHIANPFMEKAITRICNESGFESPVICTPEALLGE